MFFFSIRLTINILQAIIPQILLLRVLICQELCRSLITDEMLRIKREHQAEEKLLSTYSAVQRVLARVLKHDRMGIKHRCSIRTQHQLHSAETGVGV
jgi:hypothetical protein